MPRRLFLDRAPGGRVAVAARWVWCGLVLLIAWLALTPVPPREATLGWDKLNHAAAFAALAVVWLATRWRGWRLGLPVLLAYGLLIELLQTQVPGRSAEAADLLADAVGAVLGFALGALIGRLQRWA